MKEFTYSYYTVTNKVSLDEFTIKTQQGPIIKKEFSTLNLRYFGHSVLKNYEALTLLYTDKDQKTKKIQIYSNPGGEPFKELITELNNRYPEKNLNNMDQKEALQIIKSIKSNLIVPIILAFFIITLIICIIGYPWLRHGFDSGYKEIYVNDLAVNQDIGTRNVTIYGYLLDSTLKETTTTTYKGTTTTKVSYFIPIVDTIYKSGDPLKIILQTGELTDEEYQSIFEQTSFTGVIRNIWWEGLSSDNENFFGNIFNLKFDGSPILIEVTGEKRNDQNSLWAIGGILALVFILLIIAFAVTINQQKKKLI